MADRPEDLIDEIHCVLKELAELPADKFGGRPWDQFPPEQYMDDADRQRERWHWHFHILMDKLNWFFRNSSEYRQLEMTTLRSRVDWAMFSTASVKRDLLRVRELLQAEVRERGTVPEKAESSAQEARIPTSPQERVEFFRARWDDGGLLKLARQAHGNSINKASQRCKNEEGKPAPENTYKGWESRHRFPRGDYRPSVFSYIEEVWSKLGLVQ